MGMLLTDPRFKKRRVLDTDFSPPTSAVGMGMGMGVGAARSLQVKVFP